MSNDSPPEARSNTATPWWRRIFSLFGLGTFVVVGGVGAAALVGFAALALLYVLERALG